MTNKGKTIWFVGLPCSGKTTLAESIPKHPNTIHLDGDVLRKGINSDLRFSVKDRTENIRRTAHIAQMFNEHGNNVVASFITPTHNIQDMVKDIVNDLYFVYVECSVEECIKRDVKGMYAKALKGELPFFTGVGSPFQIPTKYSLKVNTESYTLEDSVDYLKVNIPRIK